MKKLIFLIALALLTGVAYADEPVATAEAEAPAPTEETSQDVAVPDETLAEAPTAVPAMAPSCSLVSGDVYVEGLMNPIDALRTELADDHCKHPNCPEPPCFCFGKYCACP